MVGSSVGNFSGPATATQLKKSFRISVKISTWKLSLLFESFVTQKIPSCPGIPGFAIHRLASKRGWGGGSDFV